jgi:hypothetical protein
MEQFRERFESLGIEVDWKRFKALGEVRNDVEHYYSSVGTEAVDSGLSRNPLA